jgi:hypothetical protein
VSWPRIYVFRSGPGGWYVAAECLGWHEADSLLGLVRDPVAFEVDSVPPELVGAVQDWQRGDTRAADDEATAADAEALTEGSTADSLAEFDLLLAMSRHERSLAVLREGWRGPAGPLARLYDRVLRGDQRAREALAVLSELSEGNEGPEGGSFVGF